MRKLIALLIAAAAIAPFNSPVSAELGSGNPTDAQLLRQRMTEGGRSGSGIFDIPVPPTGTMLQPAERVRRDTFGVVGRYPLQLQDLEALVFPGATLRERHALLEGLTFFSTRHTPGEHGLRNENGVGPLNNQQFCLGCHMNAAEAVSSPGLLGSGCPDGSACVSNVTRAGRSTPTNFEVTSLDLATGGGRPPDNLDAISNTGKTAAFTSFGDFSPTLLDTAPGSIGFFDPLDGARHSVISRGATSSFRSQPFGGAVQNVRPAVGSCLPKPLPPITFDTNLMGSNPDQFRRTVGERAGPPYIGRGLIEAVPTADITAHADPVVENGSSSLGNFATKLGCRSTGCISGRANMIPRSFAAHTSGPDAGMVTGFVGGVGRFGLRANGVELLQFVVGGMQGELSFTSLLNPDEIDFPTLFPGGTRKAKEPAACIAARSEIPGQPLRRFKLEVHLSVPFSIRNLLRNTAPPEFGDALLHLLHAPDPATLWPPDSEEAKVKRGAELFGIDLIAFANRTVGGAITTNGDGHDMNAINQTDRKLNCVGCHTPIQRTGRSPADVGAEHLSNVWAPIFSDLLLHHMPTITAERIAQLPRNPLVIPRPAADKEGQDDPARGELPFINTFDLPRNLADDTFANFKASAEGSEFRTPPLMGLGRIGPPFLHDGRVYLSKDTVEHEPAGTVTTNSHQTNAPLVVRRVDDAILAAIELHDLPAPDDKNTPQTPGAGCPVPPKGDSTNVDYGPSPADVICPAYDTASSHMNRSDAAEVIYRFRQLSVEDQHAVIEFLKQL